MGNAERTEPLTLIGPKGLERVVNALRVIAPELPFPIIYKEINGNEETFELADGYRLKAFRVNHGILCYGYTLELDRAGKFQLQKAMEQDPSNAEYRAAYNQMQNAGNMYRGYSGAQGYSSMGDAAATGLLCSTIPLCLCC